MIEEFEVLDSALCDYYEMGGISENGYNEIMNTMRELKKVLQKQNNWISIEDRLPVIKQKTPAYNSYVRVLVYCPINDFVGEMHYHLDEVRKKNVYRFKWHDRISPWEVTHWQPLPGAPK